MRQMDNTHKRLDWRSRGGLLAVTCGILVGAALAPAQGQGVTPAQGLPAFPPVLGTPALTQNESPGQKRKSAPQQLKLTALLTNNGPVINKGLFWRIFVPGPPNEDPKLLSERSTAQPVVKLKSGTYIVNVTFGLAHLTKTVTVSDGAPTSEKFVINAGGLKVLAQTDSGAFAPANAITYDVLSDERDQNGKRQVILQKAKPGLITRLNSGIYRIVSQLGDANATVGAEVTVEAGKLTEATVIHEAAKVTFKLVRQKGGEALADTQWTIMTQSGQIVKKTAGALPSHILAPGSYTISAKWGGSSHRRSFTVASGDNVEVEIVIR
ncbi:MAG: hypothetical protein ACR2PA_11010 [Hyphomicrobiaceae bacterium]